MKQLSYFFLTAVMAVFLCVNAWAQSNTSSTVASTVSVDKASCVIAVKMGLWRCIGLEVTAQPIQERKR